MSDMTDGRGPRAGRPDDGDTPLEPWLRTLADGYHRPPATPREAIWAGIRAARDADAADGPVATDDAVAALPPVALVLTPDDVRPARSATRGREGRRRWAGPLVALAATLLLGVGIGRWTTRSDVGSSGASAVASAGSSSRTSALARASEAGTRGAPPHIEDTVAAARDRDRFAAPGIVASPAPDGGLARGAPPEHHATPERPRDRNPSAAGAIIAPPPRLLAAAPDRSADAPSASDRASSTYQVATIQHLGQAEALLTAFRAEPRADVAPAAATDAWARELLTTTRLLLDSPAAADPRLGPLLGDLEGVLVQIVQLPAARAAAERRLIAQSLEQSDLMTHLRAAVPAGPAAPQRSGE